MRFYCINSAFQKEAQKTQKQDLDLALDRKTKLEAKQWLAIHTSVLLSTTY